MDVLMKMLVTMVIMLIHVKIAVIMVINIGRLGPRPILILIQFSGRRCGGFLGSTVEVHDVAAPCGATRRFAWLVTENCRRPTILMVAELSGARRQSTGAR